MNGNIYLSTTRWFDLDAISYFNQVEQAGGSFDLTIFDSKYTEGYVKRAHELYIQELKTSGLWEKIPELYVFFGKQCNTLPPILTKLKGDGALTNVNFTPSDYTPVGSNIGLKGNGSNKSLLTNTFTGSYPLGNLSFSALNTGNHVDSSNSSVLSVNITHNYINIGTIGGNTAQVFFRSRGNAVIEVVDIPQRHSICTRTNPNNFRVFINGNFRGQQTANDSLVQNNFVLFRRASGAHTNSRIAFAHIGFGLTDSEAQSLYGITSDFTAKFGFTIS